MRLQDSLGQRHIVFDHSSRSLLQPRILCGTLYVTGESRIAASRITNGQEMIGEKTPCLRVVRLQLHGSSQSLDCSVTATHSCKQQPVFKMRGGPAVLGTHQRLEDLHRSCRIARQAMGSGKQQQSGRMIRNCIQNFRRLLGGKYWVNAEQPRGMRNCSFECTGRFG